MMMDRFSAEDDEALVDFVAGNPVLYDVRLKEHRNVKLRDKIWYGIADKLQKTGRQCKSRWRSIRDHYYRQRRKDSTISSAELAAQKKRCTYWDRLEFLEAVETGRKTYPRTTKSSAKTKQRRDSEDDEHCSNSRDSDGASAGPCPPTHAAAIGHRSSDSPSIPYQKHKQNGNATPTEKSSSTGRDVVFARTDELSDEPGDDDDDVDLFFKAMAATVKKFPHPFVPEIKCQVFQVVCDMEMQLCRSAEDP